MDERLELKFGTEEATDAEIRHVLSLLHIPDSAYSLTVQPAEDDDFLGSGRHRFEPEIGTVVVAIVTSAIGSALYDAIKYLVAQGRGAERSAPEGGLSPTRSNVPSDAGDGPPEGEEPCSQ